MADKISKWVTSGPVFWVTKFIQAQNKGVSTNYIWHHV